MENKITAFIILNDWFKGIGVEHGTHNGYVAVPPTNKYWGKSYDDLSNIKVHGGLTYSEPVTLSETTFVSKRKIKPECVGKRTALLDNDLEFITENTEIEDDWWIFGFDTFHFGDNQIDCDKEYVTQETISLMEQLQK